MLQQYGVNDDTYDGKFHTSNAVYHATVTSLVHCASLCLDDMRCLSYFYNTQSKECVLHAISFKNTVPSQSGDGWKFYLTEDPDFPVPAVCIQGTDTIDSQHQWTFDDGTLMTYFNWNQQHHQPEGGKGILVTQLCIQGTDTVVDNSWTFDDGPLMTYFKWNKEYRQPDGGQGHAGIQISYNFTWSLLVNGQMCHVYSYASNR
ncbi:unnamed protein product [Mytilus edulis]|uniref:Apple domain-containing protein n=1 Tax=Mytilus edulis TaxID=6550 RepID=A0A8S3PLR4_MYTED|nr:unnamed protein product [Mytilus edulis]